MHGYGHVQEMSRRLKKNLDALNAKSESRKERRNQYAGMPEKDPKMAKAESRFTPEQITAAKKAIAREAVRKRKKERIVFVTTAIIAVLAAFFILIIISS